MTIKHMARPLAINALDGDGFFMGYASVFETLDAQGEIVAKGAFSRSLGALRYKNQMPAMLWMHDPTSPVGVWTALYEDENGLAVQGRLALSTQKGREAYELLKMKALTGLSIGYRVVTSRLDKKRKARVLTDVDLFEISLVTFPANDAARVSDVKAPRSSDGKKRKKCPPAGVKNMDAGKAMTRAIVSRLNRAAAQLRDNNSSRRK